MPTGLRSQSRWLAGIKTFGCYSCTDRQQGDANHPQELGRFDSSFEAWVRRVQSGMRLKSWAQSRRARHAGALKLFAEWTDRIAAGELPLPGRNARKASSATSS